MKEFLLVFCGAGLGGTMRFAVIRAMAQLITANYYAIFICNMIGCFLAGFILSYILQRHGQNWINLFFITGLAGGFTTFSAFAVDNIQMIQKGDVIYAILYIVLSIILGIVFCGAGMFSAKVIL